MFDLVARRPAMRFHVGGDAPEALGHPVTSRMQLVKLLGASEMKSLSQFDQRILGPAKIEVNFHLNNGSRVRIIHAHFAWSDTKVRILGACF